MKKRFAFLLALTLLLGGCAKEPKPTEPALTEPTTAATEPAVPDSPYPLFPNYEHRSTVEVLTGGAVGVYPLGGEDYYAVRPMGSGVLLFSGTEETTLTVLSEQGRYSVVVTDRLLYPDDCTLRITENGVAYYDETDRCVVFLDAMLQETARISMPEELTGKLVMSSDQQYVYYFDDAALRCLELNSGISRLLKECSFPSQEVTALHFEGTVLECAITDLGVKQTMYVSTATGEMLFLGEEFPTLYTGAEFYYAQWFDGYEMRNIFGELSGTSQYLVIADEGDGVYPMPQRRGVAVSTSDSTGSTVTYYDLTTGVRSAEARMAGVWMPSSMTEDSDSGLIWFLGGDSEEVTNTLYCWDTTLSATGETESCTQPHYTDEQPDTAGLELCAQTAQALASRFKVRIRIWETAASIAPEDYSFTPETRVPVYEEYLVLLEQALAVYPDNFFKTLGKNSDNDYLTICLVRGAVGSTELGSLEQAAGVHFWNEGSAYVTLVMDEDFQKTFHHEVFHAIDSYVLTETQAYDFWNDLNPKGFRYDLSYISNQGREDFQYLEKANRSFIDMYSMSFPKEDRARIMEYAVMSGNESYFESDTMQAKLKTLCDGIREAFKLKGTYLWEQYLK